MITRPSVRLSNMPISSAALTGLFRGSSCPKMAILTFLQRSATAAAISAGLPVAIRPE